MTTSDTNVPPGFDDRFKGIPPGFINLSQFETIKKLAESIPAGSDVLEIGAGFGRSTCAWLTGLKECNLHILDFWEFTKIHQGIFEKLKYYQIYDDDWRQIKSINNHYSSWRFFVGKHPNHRQIKKVFSMTTQNYRRAKLKKSYHCVYIDDGHDPKELTLLLKYFQECKIICGDDYNTAWPELCQVIDKFCKEYNKQLTTERNGFWKLI